MQRKSVDVRDVAIVRRLLSQVSEGSRHAPRNSLSPDEARRPRSATFHSLYNTGAQYVTYKKCEENGAESLYFDFGNSKSKSYEMFDDRTPEEIEKMKQRGLENYEQVIIQIKGYEFTAQYDGILRHHKHTHTHLDCKWCYILYRYIY